MDNYELDLDSEEGQAFVEEVEQIIHDIQDGTIEGEYFEF